MGINVINDPISVTALDLFSDLLVSKFRVMQFCVL